MFFFISLAAVQTTKETVAWLLSGSLRCCVIMNIGFSNLVVGSSRKPMTGRCLECGTELSRCCAKKRCATLIASFSSDSLRSALDPRTWRRSVIDTTSNMILEDNFMRAVVSMSEARWTGLIAIMRSVVVVLTCVVHQDLAYVVRHKPCR